MITGLSLAAACAISLGSARAAGPEATPTADALAGCQSKIDAAPEDGAGYYCVYGVARTEGRYPEAIAMLRALLATQPDNPRAHDNLAAMLDDTAAPGSEVHYGAAIEGYAARGQRDLEIYTRMSYADHIAPRDLDGATAQLTRARQLASELDDETLIAITDVEWARHLIRLGRDLAGALRLVRGAEAAVMAQQYYQPKMVALFTKQQLLRLHNRPAEAARVLEQIVAMNRKVGDGYAAASTVLTLAALLFNTPDLEHDRLGLDAKTVVREALALAQAHSNAYAEAGAHCLLGDHRADDPMAHYEACRAGYEEADDPGWVASAMESMAVLEADDAPERALARLDAAAQLQRDRGVGRLETPVTRALLLWHLGRDAEAVAASQRALDAIDAAFSRQPNPLARAEVLSHWSPAYYAIADRLVNAGDGPPSPAGIDAALRVLEQMRARVLIERIEAARGAKRGTDPLRDAHDRAVTTITELQRRLLEEDLSSGGRTMVLQQLEEAERDEAALSDSILGQDPAIGAVRRDASPTLAEIQAALAPDQAVLSYQLATRLPRSAPTPWPVSSSLFVITADQAFVVPLPDRVEVAAMVDLFAGLFEARDGSERAPAAGLYRDLLGGAVERLPAQTKRLVIVADGPLHRLPFAALRPTEDAPPLIDRFSTTQVPSLRLWLRLRASPGPRGAAALVFADPELPRLNPDASPERAWALSLAEGLGPLPHARAEAEALAHRLGPKTELHIGAAATEADVKRAAAEPFAVLHFASHALIDDANPWRAAIVLAPGNAGEDGLLQ
ncbi:MAG: CHAT domain-containing protein, partial [Myxococcota bacterium]